MACVVCFLGGWRGDDWAAQVYRADQVARWGFILWDPGWYGGAYPLNYSLIYPLVAAYLGLWLVAAASAVGATYCFDRLVTRELGRRPAGSWYFAASTVVEVAIGQLPTLAGEALALGSVLCLAGYRMAATPAATGSPGVPGGPAPLAGHLPPGYSQWARLSAGLVLAILAALTSPVVGAFLALTFVAWGLGEVGRTTGKTVGVLLFASGVTIVSSAALPLVFPGAGYFPFGFTDFLVVLVICGLLASPLLQASRPVRVAALIYGAVSTALFFIPTQMGDNDIRFAAYIGVPLVICYLPRLVESLERLDVQKVAHALGRSGRWHPARARPVGHATALVLAFALTGGLVFWHWSPMAEALGGPANGPSSTPGFYKPLITELARLTKGRPVRVEVPPTDHHWESAYVAPAFPLARGWERQLDIAYNPLFYAPGPLSAAAYRNWLLANGVSFVALPNAPLDYAAVAEVTLLRSGKANGLLQVWHSVSWRLWRVLGSGGLASGPAAVTSLSPRSVTAQFDRMGSSIIKVRWSAYWSLAGPTARHACARPAPGGWTVLSTSVAGTVELNLSVLDPNHGTCSRVGGVRS